MSRAGRIERRVRGAFMLGTLVGLMTVPILLLSEEEAADFITRVAKRLKE